MASELYCNERKRVSKKAFKKQRVRVVSFREVKRNNRLEQGTGNVPFYDLAFRDALPNISQLERL